MATDLQAHVRSVRDTGEALRRETASLVTALRKPQVRGSWGETQLKNVAEMAGMVERCDFDLQVTSQADGQTLRPDMRVHLAEGKHVFVDSKVPLSAFLDAAETDDEQLRSAHLATLRPARAHPRRPALEQEVLEGGRVAGVRRPVPARARRSSPPRWSRCPTSTNTPSSATSCSPRRPR